MQGREWQIGIVGTFDVENYGDLLFPLVAEAELAARLGAVRLHRFSYGVQQPPDWPYAVTSLQDLPGRVGELDALLIGGGYLVRFDKDVADGYAPPTPQIHHPTGYWLTPALLALQHDVPVIWNAPGMHCNAIPAWAGPLLTMALALSRYVAVRDEPSRATLAEYAGDTPISVLPDTAFGITRALAAAAVEEAARLRAAAGVTGRYIVLQAAGGLDPFVRFFARHLGRALDLHVLAVPLGPALGNRIELLGDAASAFARLPAWPQPSVLAALIAGADAVIGYSYHLAITALAAGVPVFTPHRLHEGKFSALAPFDTVHALVDGREPDLDWFLARLGRTTPSAPVRAAQGELEAHWDRVAASVRAGRTTTSTTLDRFWQSLPTVLEDAEDAAAAAEAAAAAAADAAVATAAAAQAEHLRMRAELTAAMAAVMAHADALAEARMEIAERELRIARLNATLSWKVTAPLRFMRDRVLGKKQGPR